MFSQQNEYSSLQQAQTVMQNMIPEVRGLFPQVERLLRLLLVCPATSCTTERSFSALRRLKTWLRTTMTQQRLNAVAVCHVHQEILDSLDIIWSWQKNLQVVQTFAEDYLETGSKQK